MNDKIQPFFFQNIRNNRWTLLFAIIFVLEFILFKQYIVREIVPYFPIGFDQSSYLLKSYQVYEDWISGTKIHPNQLVMPTSTLFIPQAVLFYFVLGASRFTALSINFIYFIALQITLITTVRWLFKSEIMATIALGLLLSISSPFFFHGGIDDFRIDFLAFCLYGILTCVIVRSQVFSDRSYTQLAALVACVLILMRTLTFVYVAFVTATLLSGFFLLRSKKYLKNKLINIILFSILVIIPVSFFLWIDKSEIYSYYIQQSMTKEAHFRNLESHTTDLISNLIFYPTMILDYHIGPVCQKLIMALLLTSLTLFIFTFKKWQTQKIKLEIIIFLAAAILCPLLVLTLFPSKSDCVGAIVLIPFVLLIILTCSVLVHYKKISLLIAGIVLIVGLHNWTTHLMRNNFLYGQKTVMINKMYDDIGHYIQSVNLNPVRFSTDQFTEYLLANNLTILYYEKYKIFLKGIIPTIGQSNFSFSADETKKLTEESEVFVLNENEYSSSNIPINSSINTLKPALINILKTQFILLGEYFYDTQHFKVFVKPSFAVRGLSHDGWITQNGIILTVPKAVAKRAQKLILSGTTPTHLIPPHLNVSAIATDEEDQQITIPTEFNVLADHYTIELRLPKTINSQLIIKLKFSHFLIPKELHMGNDLRKLVLMQPTFKQAILLKNCC